MKPDFSKQHDFRRDGDAVSADDRLAWINATSSEMREQGAIWVRASIHPQNADIVLVEGWTANAPDQDEAEFQYFDE